MRSSLAVVGFVQGLFRGFFIGQIWIVLCTESLSALKANALNESETCVHFCIGKPRNCNANLLLCLDACSDFTVTSESTT